MSLLWVEKVGGREFIALLLLALIAVPMVPVPTATSSTRLESEESYPIIVPLWRGAEANAAAFTEDERYVIVWTNCYGWYSHGYVLVVGPRGNACVRVYETSSGRLTASVCGAGSAVAGFYKLEGSRLVKLWVSPALEISIRGYVFHDKVVVVTRGGMLVAFDLQGNVINTTYITYPGNPYQSVYVDSGVAFTDDGKYVAVGPAADVVTFPAPVVLVDLETWTLRHIFMVDSRVLRIAIDPEREFVIVGEQDGDLWIVPFNSTVEPLVSNGTALWHVRRPAGISSMAYNGRYLAVGDRDGWMALYVVDDPRNPQLVTNITDPDAGYRHGVYAPTSLSDSGIGGMDRLSRIVVYHNPYNGYTWFLHVPTRTWYKHSGGTVNVVCYAYPAAVAPSGTYVYAGQTLFMIVYRGAAKYPRLRFWTHTEMLLGLRPMDRAIVLAAPSTENYTATFASGRLEIRRILVEPVVVDLVRDADVVEGRLSRMVDRGMLTAWIIDESNAEVRELRIVRGTEVHDALGPVGSAENYVATLGVVHFVPPPYFVEGRAVYATVISIDVDAPLSVYNAVTLRGSMLVHTSIALYDKNKRALGVLGIPVQIGGPAMGLRAFSRIANRVLDYLLAKRGVVVVPRALEIATSQTVARVAGVVGVALIAWGGIDAALIAWGGLGDVRARTWLVIAPVVEARGLRMTALQLELPLEESKNVETYYSMLRALFTRLGFWDVGFRVHYPCQTWSEYRALLATGYRPVIRLDTLLEETLVAKHADMGLSLEEMTITGVYIMIVVELSARETFWEWLFGLGGVDAAAVTLVSASMLQVRAKLIAETVTDPARIVAILRSVRINGVPYKLIPGPRSAYVEFEVNSPVLSIDMGRRLGHLADVALRLNIVVEAPFRPLGNFGYTATLHYDWSPQLWIDRIEFVDMPYPMLRAERIFVYRYGNFTNDVTGAFELSYTVDDPESPSGKLYYYITRENTKFLDPANGGIMQPCKTYIFNYYYREPPDAGIVVYLNGTKVTSTLAHHATVVINSTAEQDVEYTLEVNVKYFEGLEEKLLLSKTIADKVRVVANGTAYRIYDITSFVDAAIEFMRTMNRTAYVELIGRITKAEYNYYRSNDEFRVVYYPPPTLPPPVPGGLYSVTVKVYEYVLSSNTWIPSASTTVEVYYGTDVESSKLVYTATTSESGVTVFSLEGGTWTFRAVKEGFTEAIVTAPIFNDTVIQLYLSPVPQPPPESRTYVKENVTVMFSVYDATNGSAVPNAAITLVFTEPLNSSYYGTSFEAVTDASGKATLEVPIGIYNVTVNATGYRLFRAQYLFDKDTVVNIALVPEAINVADYAKLEVRVYYADGKPYTGAHVEIRDVGGALIAALATNSYGNAVVLLPRGHDYEVIVSVSEPLLNRSFTDSITIALTQDTVVTFTVPWNSTQPPITINATPRYWLSVQVVWANGLPFHGAVVEVFNYTSGELIDRLVTNGTGTVHFLLPAFQEYIIWVNATNPYNATRYQAIFILNLTDNRWITVELPWLPEQPELATRYRVLVYAYDSTSGRSIGGVTVVMRKGDVAWIAETNSSGYAQLWLPFLGLYNVTGIHPDYYQAVWRTVQVYENNTLINLPMSPVLLNYAEVPPPPLNSSAYPPIYINGTPHYWLSVQVLYRDGYPFHGANVTVIDLETGLTIATGVTNGTGFIHFLVPVNKTIKYAVDAFNPELNETYHDERVLDVTQHYYFVHVVPWASKYYSPEVWLKEVRFVVHRGQGYFFGNVSHLVLLSLWTNRPQNVTVLIGLYNVTGGAWVASKTVTLSLAEGLNTFFEWVNVNASAGGYFRVFANITGWEYDTDITNNWGWSNTVFLKPMVDIEVFVLWRPVEQKQPWTILPEDVIEIDIGIRMPINTTTVPAKLSWRVERLDLSTLTLTVLRGSDEELRIVEPGMVWRNITVRVPWTSRIVVFVNVTHPWEDVAYDNCVNVTIPIDPDVKLSIVEKPAVVMESSVFKVVVNITSNVEPGKGIGWVSIVDNTTATLLKMVEIELAPRKALELEVKAPENPTTFLIIRAPATTHYITAQFTGDMYTGNNAEEFTVTVVSYQWLTVIAVIVVAIAVIAAIKALTHTVHDIRQKTRKFVKKRS